MGSRRVSGTRSAARRPADAVPPLTGHLTDMPSPQAEVADPACEEKP